MKGYDSLFGNRSLLFKAIIEALKKKDKYLLRA